VVPWGRSLAEYAKMFALTPQDLRGNILDCAAGPASFNAEATAAGHRVVSSDPLYRHPAADIRRRVEETSDTPIEIVRAASDRFVWRDIRSPEHLAEVRLTAMNLFLADLPAGLTEGRYRTDELPRLNLDDGSFDLDLCSHFLFLYSDQFTADFHVAAIREMCRFAAKTRVFPLLGAYGSPSPHVEPVIHPLRGSGYMVERRRVPYEFLRGANEMLVVTGP
jgi:hypothetical protein